MGSSSPKRLSRAGILLGWVSLFTDLAAGMVTPPLPALLAGLGGGALALGVL